LSRKITGRLVLPVFERSKEEHSTETFLYLLLVEYIFLGGIGLLDVSVLRKNICGIRGAFLTKNGEMQNIDMDINRDVEHLSRAIFYLFDFVYQKKGNIRKLCIISDDQLFLFFYNLYVLGIICSQDVNTILLDVVARGFLELATESGSLCEAPEKLEFPKTLAKKVPHFNQSQEKILLDAPDYAGQVLKFINGTRTVRDIIEQSKLPPEVVLDVILAYSKRSVLEF
jgi:hypothetical protein